MGHDHPHGGTLSVRGLARRNVTMLACVVASMIGLGPLFLLGTQAVPIRAELGFDEAALGLVISGRFLVASLGSVPLGRLAQRVGPTRALRDSVIVEVVLLAAMATIADSWAVFTTLLMATGLVHAFGQPAGDLWLARYVRFERQGLAFGLKQASVPTMSLLAGLAVPLVTVRYGWRTTFVLAAVASSLLLLAIRPGDAPAEARSAVDRSSDVPMDNLAIMAIGLAFAGGAVNAFNGFAVSSLVEAGTSESLAGFLYAIGAVVGIGTRLGLGVRADRRPGPLVPLVIGMMAVGAVGYAAMATGVRLAMALATPVVFATGWGWPGIFYLSMMRINPGAPAAATSTLNAGGFAGAVAVPVLFGVLARSFYTTAWLLLAACSLVAAGTLALGLRSLRRWAVTSGRRPPAEGPS